MVEELVDVMVLLVHITLLVEVALTDPQELLLMLVVVMVALIIMINQFQVEME